MLSRFFVLTALVMGLCAAALAQADVRPTDAAMAKCLETHKATMPRAKCYSEASDAWTKDVDDKYSALQKMLPANLIETFNDSQAAWIKYRDTEWRFLDVKNAKQTGTGHIAGRIIERMAPVRERAIALDDLYETYKQQ